MRKLLLSLILLGSAGYATAAERGPGLVGSVGYQQMFRSSWTNIAHAGILSTGCVTIQGFRVATTTGSNDVDIGIYNATSTIHTRPTHFVASYTATTNNDGDFYAHLSSGGVYLIRANAGATLFGINFLWDNVSPACMPIR